MMEMAAATLEVFVPARKEHLRERALRRDARGQRRRLRLRRPVPKAAPQRPVATA